LAGEFRFRCDPAGVAEARRWLDVCLRDELGRDRSGAIVADALVIVSELVTNAVNARCGSGRLAWSSRAGWLRLTVFDDAPGWPVMRDPGPFDSGGRGLRIVQGLAAESGTRAVVGGKEAWAVLALPAAPASR
jgi:hypothetical protein